MTREKAIVKLAYARQNADEELDPDWCGALDMAIKALEYKDALDKIRAEIEEVYLNITYKENHKVGGTWGLRKALEIIDKYKAESEDME